VLPARATAQGGAAVQRHAAARVPPVYRPQSTAPKAPPAANRVEAATAQRQTMPSVPAVYRPQSAAAKVPPPVLQRQAVAQRTPSRAVQRYVAFTHPTEGPLLVSENMRFLKHAGADTDLWAQDAEIKEAARLLAANSIGIVDVVAGAKMTFLNEEFRQVLVKQRGKPVTAAPAVSSSVKSISSDSIPKSTDPFDIWLDFLDASRGKTMGQVMTGSYKVDYPNRNAYPYGAFSAIRTQLHLEFAAVMEKGTKQVASSYGTASLGAVKGEDIKAPINQFMDMLRSWKLRASQATPGSHDFTFLPTECGGFSKMIMGGADASQQGVRPGDRMKLLGLGDLPGPWQNHYAAVIMQDGGDTATLESAAALDKWWFGMYGGANVGQTFAAKTLLEKLRIGVRRGEAGAQEALDYAEAVVGGADATTVTRLGLALPAKAKQDVDGIVAQAGITVQAIKDARVERALARLELAVK
jgi:hypothetical protein